jgi:glycogen phosphorylase
MKNAMRVTGPEYNTNRMVREYTEQMYIPAQAQCKVLSAEKYKRAKKLAAWRQSLMANWSSLQLLESFADPLPQVKVGEHLTVRIKIEMGQLDPADIKVEIYYGILSAGGDITDPKIILMEHQQHTKGKPHEFAGTIPLSTSGRMGYAVRVLPSHPDILNPIKLGLIRWA